MLQDSIEYRKLCQEAGAGSSVFEERKTYLQQKWPQSKIGILTSEYDRLIAPLLYNPIGPLYIALIADNLEVFKNQLELYPISDTTQTRDAIARACLCGSKKVAQFLLEKEKRFDYTLSGNEYLLVHVAASNNQEWAKEIAIQMAQAGKEKPSDLLITANYAMRDTIDKIFEKYQPKAPTMRFSSASASTSSSVSTSSPTSTKALDLPLPPRPLRSK